LIRKLLSAWSSRKAPDVSYLVIHREEFVSATTDILTALDKMHEVGNGARVYTLEGVLLATHLGRAGRTMAMTFHRVGWTEDHINTKDFADFEAT